MLQCGEATKNQQLVIVSLWFFCFTILKHEFTVAACALIARTLGSWVRILLKALILVLVFVCCAVL
jgi:hypothetical protein